MKILCVIDDLGSGGAQRQLVNAGRGLARRGHQVEFLVYHPAAHFRPELDADGIPVRGSKKRHRFSWSPVRALRRAIQGGGFGHVLAFLETPAVYAELAAVGLGRVRLVVGERSSVPSRRVSWARVLKSHLHRVSDAVVTNSYAHRDWMAAHFPFLTSRLSVIWNGIDLAEFHPSTGPSSSSEGLRLLGIGRLTAQKNVLRLIDAVASCRAQGVKLRVQWAGRVDDSMEAERARCLLAERGLERDWTWLGERSDIPALLRAQDALIAPSLWEGLPNAVCEALASGLPVLASDVSDNARLIADGERGYVFAPEDTSAIAAAIARLEALPEASRLAMGMRGRAFAESFLGIDAMVGSYERLMASLEVDP